ncbi:hypothetical protein NCCP2222_08410 [Sporosarcina sp. NCCP-2222]|uniref:response regulator n=1 Tax=Sporosarcina sp. NCCP-2222 TaxID=2935073 RepID=UPI00208BC09C|nr:response regulator [Sporosarcina sp. NCCP-2222]GKV54894.1 hypothetical protein NCCP2222_08410 [Sporosarcina sp. NCCP-2222]
MDTPFVLHISGSLSETEWLSEFMDSEQLPGATVKSIKDGLDRLDVLHPSVILLSLPSTAAMTLLSEINELADQALKRLIPLLIIGDPPSDFGKEKLFEQGAFDFVVRPLDQQAFHHLLQTRIAFKRKVDQLLSSRKHSDDNLAQPLSSRTVEIILIDDDPIALEIMKQQFSTLQIEDSEVKIITFKNGADFVAADWYDPKHYYAIILDGIMPKMTGFEVLSHIRSAYSNKNILIFMLTSRSGSLDMEHALEAGADDYITKPFRPKEVALRVRRLMTRLFK